MTSTQSAPAPDPQHGSLAEWLSYLESLNIREINLGLERVNEVASRLNLEQPSHPVISVAGTNGKGSSVAIADAIYRRAGYRTAVYMSPHLLRFTERIKIDGEEVSEAALCRAFAKINHARGDVPLTYFEFATLAAFLLVAESDIDLAIFEVGLGGKLDAVNWYDADLAIVTSIGLDHTEWLGDTREKIAVEKAGIFRPDAWAVSSDPDTPDTIFEAAHAINTKLSVFGADYGIEVTDLAWHWWARSDSGANELLAELPPPRLSGSFQYRNAAGVIKAVKLLADRLPVDDEHIRQALADVRLPGRFQTTSLAGVEWVLDVAHNAQAAMALAENLASLPRVSRCHIVMGMLSDKDHRGVVGILAPFVTDWNFVSLPSPRAVDGSELEEKCQDLLLNRNTINFATVAEALKAIRAIAEQGERVIVCGSFVTVGAALRELQLELGTS